MLPIFWKNSDLQSSDPRKKSNGFSREYSRTSFDFSNKTLMEGMKTKYREKFRFNLGMK